MSAGAAITRALVVARRELTAYFVAPLAYFVATMFLIVQGYSFWLFLRILNERPLQHGAVLQYFFGGTVLFWLFVMFLAAVITMRLVAEERRSGTLEPLLTAPIAEASIVAGKYLGCLGFYVALWIPTGVYVLLLRAYSPAGVDAGPVAAGYLGTLVVSSSALALGLFFSTITRNQILAAVLSFVTLSMLLLVGPLGRLVAWPPAAAIFRYIDLFACMEDFGRGIVDSRRFVYHLSIVAVALFAATRALAAGRATSLNRRALVEVALAALIAVGLNVLAARHYARADWTRGRTFALSEKSTALFRDLPRDVDVIVFMIPSGQEANDLYGDVHELLERARRLSPRLHVEYVDVDREPERLKTVGKKYGVSGDDLVDGVVVVASGDQSKFLTRSELADYDYAAVTESPGTPPPMKAWKGEQALASAVLAVTDERAPAVCFITGHGEPAIDGFDPDAFGDFAEELRRDHQAPRAITLDRGVPADCDVAVLAGPDRALPKPDAVELDRFLERGGRLFVLLGPSFDAKVTRFVDVGVEDMLDRWGASPRNDIVVDEPRLRGSAVAFAVTQGYADHPITARLMGHQTLWATVRQIVPTPKEGAVDARELVHTSDAAWGETDLGIFRAEAELRYDPGVDVKGPLSIAVAAERTAGTGKGARLVVFGSSEMAMNRMLLAGYNRDLMLAAVAWLEHRPERIAIGPRPTEHLRLSLDDAQLSRVLAIAVGALPLLVLLLGAGVFWVRRS